MLAAAPVSAQCPDRQVLWNRLTFLAGHSAEPQNTGQLGALLKELNGYEENVANCGPSYDSALALLLQRTGAVHYKLDDYIQAIRYTRRSITMIDRRDKYALHARHQVKNYYNLSVYYSALNRIPEKMEAIDSCINIAMRLQYVDYISLYALVTRTEYLFDIGDYERCVRYATLGETITGLYSRGEDSIGFVMNLLLLKVNSMLKFQQYDQARQVLSEKIGEYRRAGAKEHLGTLYERMAGVYLQFGDIAKAKDYFHQAVQHDRNAGFSLGCMQTINTEGYNLYFSYFKDYNLALTTFRKALEYAPKNRAPDGLERMELMIIHKNIANVFVRSGKYDSAFRYFRMAFDQVSPGTDENHLLHSLDSFILFKKISYVTALVIDKGDAYLQQSRETGDRTLLNKAILVYKTADRLLDKIKTGQTEIRSRLLWRSDSRRLYEHAIEACYLQHNAGGALYFFEKSRAVILNDQLSERHLVGEEDILSQAQLKNNIIQLERELRQPGIGPGRYKEIQQAVFIKKQELERLSAAIRKRNPLFYHALLDTGFINLTQVRNIVLKDHQALVELFSGDSSVYAMVITAKDMRLRKINKTRFDSTANAFISFISDPGILNTRFGHFKETSSRLYRLIFGDVALPAGRIIVSPDGRYFPFEALIRQGKREDYTYLLYDHAISYTYSARYLLNRFKQPGRSTRGALFMGIAPVRFPKGPGLEDLPESDHSLEKLASYFGSGDLLLYEKASRENFIKQFYRYKFVQLYTHASDSGFTGEPVIYLADSSLYLSDLVPGRIPVTELIVLSACETGKGTLYKGEGVFNFNRGFAALGIPSSISNLWSVDATSTYRLTELFYEQLSEGVPPDLALQQAKMDFIGTGSKEKALPYFWAAPVLVGRTDILETGEHFAWFKIVLITGMAGLFLSGIIYLTKYKRRAEK
jgi:CHAT domain-containing protein/tetratricopeptide (TPR) repeat protein